MNLSDFRDLIASLRVDYQAFQSKRKNWGKFNDNPAIAPALNRIFGNEDQIIINRHDVRTYGVDSGHYPTT